jgi:hypothetical protein
MMVRREAGPPERQPEMLMGELENNSRKPRNLVIKLTLLTAQKYSTYSFSW